MTGNKQPLPATAEFSSLQKAFSNLTLIFDGLENTKNLIIDIFNHTTTKELIGFNSTMLFQASALQVQIPIYQEKAAGF